MTWRRNSSSTCFQFNRTPGENPTAAIVDGTAPADLTVTGLAKALPYSWAEQERTRSLR
jgi:hypothetical protein